MSDIKGREMSLEEIHKVQINILDKIDETCKNLNLRYSLGGGSLLGAVRHKGYIPWDDDIDIMLPRPDYETLIKSFKCKYPHLIIQDYNTDIAYQLRWARVYDNRTILISKNTIDGVFVDVFPVDGLPPLNEMKDYMDRLKKLRRNLARVTKHHSEAVQKNYYVLRFKYYIKRIIFPSRKRVVTELENLFHSYPFESSDYAGAITGMFGIKEHMSVDVFKEYIWLEFEGKKYMCIKRYDAYLTQHYGDYMQLPPINKRKTHHEFKVYWKETI